MLNYVTIRIKVVVVESGGARGGRRGREEDTVDVSSKPSGPATLFDFLNDKIHVPETKGRGCSNTKCLCIKV